MKSQCHRKCSGQFNRDGRALCFGGAFFFVWKCERVCAIIVFEILCRLKSNGEISGGI